MISGYGSQAVAEGLRAAGQLGEAYFGPPGRALLAGFWLAASPTGRVAASEYRPDLRSDAAVFAANVDGPLNPPEHQPGRPRVKHLMFLFFAQDIHRRSVDLPSQ